MRKVILRMNEQEKYIVIKNLSEGKINKERASVKLKLSIRQIYRLLKRYEKSGKSAFVHGNRGKKPAISIDPSLSNRIIQLYKEKYQGFDYSF